MAGKGLNVRPRIRRSSDDLEPELIPIARPPSHAIVRWQQLTRIRLQLGVIEITAEPKEGIRALRQRFGPLPRVDERSGIFPQRGKSLLDDVGRYGPQPTCRKRPSHECSDAEAGRPPKSALQLCGLPEERCLRPTPRRSGIYRLLGIRNFRSGRQRRGPEETSPLVGHRLILPPSTARQFSGSPSLPLVTLLQLHQSNGVRGGGRRNQRAFANDSLVLPDLAAQAGVNEPDMGRGSDPNQGEGSLVRNGQLADCQPRCGKSLPSRDLIQRNPMVDAVSSRDDQLPRTEQSAAARLPSVIAQPSPMWRKVGSVPGWQ